MPNMVVVFIASLIPLIIGFIYYHKNVLGTTWMHEIGTNPEELQKGNMALIFGNTFVFSLMLAFVFPQIVIHQNGVVSALMNNKSPEDVAYLANFMEKYGKNFRTFKHGAFHGVLYALFFALPVLGINALFERKSFKYIFIHLGYWLITLAIMGGIVCQWG